MSLDSSARAAILAGALFSSPLPETLTERRVEVPAIRLVVPHERPPLNLNAAIFHYRVDLEGNVTVMPTPELCTRPRCRHPRGTKSR